MDPLPFLTLIGVAVALGTLGARARQRPTVGSPLAAAHVVVFATWGLLAAVDWALWVAVALAAVALVLPIQVFAHARRLARRGDFRRAGRWALALAAARRDPNARAWAAAWSAMHPWSLGDPAPAEAVLIELAARTSPVERAAREWLLGATRSWGRARFARALDLQARALCELGEVEAGVETAGRVWRRGRYTWPALSRARAVMLAPLAFAGRVEESARTCALLRLPQAASQVWRATAMAAAGEREAAAAMLDALAAGGSRLPAGLRAGIRARRESLPAPVTLGPAALAVLDEARREIDAGTVVRLRRALSRPAVLVVIGVILAGFAAQIARGSSTDPEVALALGALDVNGALPTESWRLVTYGLLHHGVLHLATNLLAVMLVGPVVATGVGSLGFLLTFAGSVVGAGVCISLFGSPSLTLGASGGAMGLVGAVIAITALHPTVRGTRTAGATARLAIALVVMQALFDALTPNVSFVGHLAGGGWGLLVGAGVLVISRARRANRRDAA